MDTKKSSILIVEARFYGDITSDLANSAIEVLDKGGWIYERITVPGVLEIPAAILYALQNNNANSARPHYAGFISLGCVIRGETDHYGYICRESSRALMDLTMKFSIAHGFGILTVENRNQAETRADPQGKNYGGNAANACLRMIDLKHYFNQPKQS